MKIAGAAGEIDPVAAPAAFDIETDRSPLLVVHARVHCEEKPIEASPEMIVETCEAPQSPLSVVQEQLDSVASRIVAAGGEIRTFEIVLLARSGGDDLSR